MKVDRHSDLDELDDQKTGIGAVSMRFSPIQAMNSIGFRVFIIVLFASVAKLIVINEGPDYTVANVPAVNSLLLLPWFGSILYRNLPASQFVQP